MKQNTYDTQIASDSVGTACTEIDTKLFSNVKDNVIETYYKHVNADGSNAYYLHQQDFVWKTEETEHNGIVYKLSVKDITDERIISVDPDTLIDMLAKPITVRIANYKGDVLDHPVEISSDGLNVQYALYDNTITMKSDKQKIIESTKNIVSTFMHKLQGKPIPYDSSKGAISVMGNAV